MVRIKNRWLLVRLDFESSSSRPSRTDNNRDASTAASKRFRVRDEANLMDLENLSTGEQENVFPSRKEIFFALHKNHVENFGEGACGEAQYIQGSFVASMILCRLILS